MKNPWPVAQEIMRTLRPTWLAGLLIIAAVIALQVPQAVDTLGEIAEQGFFSAHQLSLLIMVLAIAICGWYFPRALLYVQYWFTPPNRPLLERARAVTPRILGVLPILALALAFLRKGRWGFAVFYLLVGGLFCLALHFRRRMVGSVPLQTSLPAKSVIALGAILLASLILLIAFLRVPVGVPQSLGPLAIVLYALASWIAFGSAVLIYVSYRFRVPSLVVVLLLLTALFSIWNDNHRIRKGTADDPWDRVAVADQIEAWTAYRAQGWRERNPGAAYPLFLVAAEGGGIRAAYWTASVLAHLEEEGRLPGFACHVFAISGVSGGSLGGAVFAALIADRVANKGYSCDGSTTELPSQGLAEEARDILGEDFLGPALAGLFFPDLMQRFNPIPDRACPQALRLDDGRCRLHFPDRASYLEKAWEAAWRAKMGTDRFAEDFRGLWKDELRLQVPSLFLNGTWVQDGKRVVTSNLRVEPPILADDGIAELAQSIRLSTAAHMSARFTYVSPAGTVPGSRKQVVDGGYFENSGAETAEELLAMIPEESNGLTLDPYVLIISNRQESEGGSIGVLGETLAPVKTLFATRSARGALAELSLVTRTSARGGRACQIILPTSEQATVPLGWILSERTRAHIDEQARQKATLEHLLGSSELTPPELPRCSG